MLRRLCQRLCLSRIVCAVVLVKPPFSALCHHSLMIKHLQCVGWCGGGMLHLLFVSPLPCPKTEEPRHVFGNLLPGHSCW